MPRPGSTTVARTALLLHDRLLATRVDGASLAAFRILFGLLMAIATVRVMALGWVDEFYVLPTFHFTWEPFPWVAPLPASLMHLHFAALAVLALAVALGFHYRVSMLLFFVGFTYVELIDKTTYLNHYYLVSLLSGLLVVLPAHQIWSVDRWRQPRPATRTVAAWTVNLLRFQIGVVYVFAGLAKLSADWLLDAQPLRIWLAARSDLSIVGPFFTQIWCGLRLQLVRRGLRSDDRLFSAVAPDATRRICDGHRLPRDDGSALSDRDVSVDHDRRNARSSSLPTGHDTGSGAEALTDSPIYRLTNLPNHQFTNFTRSPSRFSPSTPSSRLRCRFAPTGRALMQIGRAAASTSRGESC